MTNGYFKKIICSIRQKPAQCPQTIKQLINYTE